MKKKWLVLVLALFPVTGFTAGAGAVLDAVEVSLNDKVSLQNGAKLFVNYCMSCHSAKYMRYNRMAEDLEIPEALVKEQMIFPTGKIGDTMNITMSADDAQEWFGVAPPDLTLIGKLYSPQWLYTYLRSFYLDESTASGWNNTVFPNIAMPHVMYGLQGIQKANITTHVDEQGHAQQVTELELVKAGSMSTEEFDRSMRDLTNFLYYMAEPARMVRIKYGIWTMLFLFVFGVLALMLKKEYWRDVH